MIYEFAVEPELVARWGSRNNYRRFMEKFGLNQRRVVARFPKRWKKLVWDAFEQLDGTTFGDRKRIEEILNHLSARMTKRAAAMETTWIDAAEQEHQVRKFHLILATQNPKDLSDILLGTDLDQLYDGLVDLPHVISVERSPKKLCEPIAPILRCAGKIVFVDPHFDAGKRRFLNTFEMFFDAIIKNRCGPENPEIEIHTSIERYFKSGEERSESQEMKLAEEAIIKPCRKYLPRILPEGLVLKTVVWKQKPGGVQLHNRYILTDIGSVQFAHGLDCFDGDNSIGGEGCFPDDEITCLTEDVHIKKWNHYLGKPSAFKLVAPETEIKGKKG